MHAQAAVNTYSLIDSAAVTVKHELEQNLQLAIESAWVSALEPIESSAKDMVRDFADNLRKQLDDSIRTAFELGKSDTLADLKQQLIQLLELLSVTLRVPLLTPRVSRSFVLGCGVVDATITVAGGVVGGYRNIKGGCGAGGETIDD